MKLVRKLIVSLIIVAVILMQISPIAMASEDEVLHVQLGTRDLTQEQIDEIGKNPELLKLRSYLDTQYLLSQAEQEMNEASAKYAATISQEEQSNQSLRASNNISIGTDETYYVSDTGNEGSSADLFSENQTRWGSFYSDSFSRTAGIGSASAWAYNAVKINVIGSGSRLAYIRFKGNYSGQTYPGVTGTASVRVRVSVYDLTAGSEIGSSGVLDISDSVLGSNHNEVLFNKSVLVNLQAGHSYLLRYGVATATSNYGPQMCTADFYHDSYHGVYQDYVTVDWQ